MRDLGGLKALFLVGPTASGKGALAKALALRHGLEIVSMDSMKVYRGMDVGTAKPSDRTNPPVHMLDVADPSGEFDLASWIAGAENALVDISARGAAALFCGGTGLYLKGFLSGIFEGPPANPGIRARLAAEAEASGVEALHERLRAADPAAAEKIGRRDLKRVMRALEVIELTGRPVSAARTQFGGRRPGLQAVLVGIDRDRPELFERADRRIDRMIQAGFLDEVARVFGSGAAISRSASQALGYGELLDHLKGNFSLEEALVRIRRRTRVFIRRQAAWFRRFPDIKWIRVSGPSDSPGVLEEARLAFGLEKRP